MDMKCKVRENLQKLPKSRLKDIYTDMELLADKLNLTVAGKKLPFIKVPLLLEKKNFASLFDGFQLLVDALLNMEDHALAKQEGQIFKRLYGSLTDGGRRMLAGAGYESSSSRKRRQRRIDAYLLNNGVLAAIEINQAAPLALSFHDTCQDMIKLLLNNIDLPYEPNYLHEHLLDWFLAEYKERFGSGFPKLIAVTIEHGYPPKFSDLPNIARRIETLAKRKYEQNLKVRLCFPYEVELINGSPCLRNEVIDLIWRNSVYMTDYRRENKNIHAYETILKRSEQHLIVNSSKAWLTRTKETFSIFWDDQLVAQMGLDQKSVRVLRSIIPETYNLQHASLMFEKIATEKDLWISKPADAGFGQGVEFGSNHTQNTWRALLQDRAAQEGFVFQKRIEYPSLELLDLGPEGDLANFCVEYDFCPHHVNGVFTQTALSRANLKTFCADKTLKMNLVSGGALLPVGLI